jgi:hypothetical protein
MFSSVMIGCAGLVKPLYLTFLILPLVQIFKQYRCEKAVTGASSKTWFLAAAVIGMAVVPAIFVLAWFTYRGALRDLIEVHLLYALKVYSSTAPARQWEVLWSIARFFLSDQVAFAIPVIVAGGYSLLRKSRDGAYVVLPWITVALMCVAAQGRFYKYHWVVVFPPVLLLAAAGFDSLRVLSLGEGADWWHRAVRLFSKIALMLAIAAFLKLTLVPAYGVGRWLKVMTGRIGFREYYALHVAGAFVAGDDMTAAAYIRERTSPDDTVAVYGNNAGINFLSGRRNPTRFVFALPLTQGGQDSPRTKYRHEYMMALHRNRPVYLVVGVPWGALTKDKAVQDFPEFQTFLDESYQLERRIGSLELFHLKPLPHRSAEDQECKDTALYRLAVHPGNGRAKSRPVG